MSYPTPIFDSITVNRTVEVGGSPVLTSSAIPAGTTGELLTATGTSGAAGVISASNVLTTAANGTTASSVAARENITLDAVLDFGADPTGNADATTAIQTGLNVIEMLGGGTLRVVGQFKITSTLTIQKSSVGILGDGCGQLHTDGTWAAPSRLIWEGAAGGMIMSCAPVANTTTGKALINNAVVGVLFDCNSIAATGLFIGSCRHGTFDVGYLNPVTGTANTAGVVFDCIDLSEYNDTQYNQVSITGAELGSGGKGLLLQSTSRGGFNNGVSDFGNTSYNNFISVDIHYWRGVAITLRETDNNVFWQYGCNAPPFIPPLYPTPPYATANSIELCGSSDPVVAFPACSNVFWHGGTAGPVVSFGTATYTHPAGVSGGNPWPNIFPVWDSGNQPTLPVAETGSYLSVGTIQWVDYQKGLVNPIISDNVANVESMLVSGASGSGALIPGGVIMHSTGAFTSRFVAPAEQVVWSFIVGDDGTARLVPIQGGTSLALNNTTGTVIVPGTLTMPSPTVLGASVTAAYSNSAGGVVYTATDPNGGSFIWAVAGGGYTVEGAMILGQAQGSPPTLSIEVEVDIINEPLFAADGYFSSINGMKIGSNTGTLDLANSSKLATVGAYATTLTATGATSLTLPTTGTLVAIGSSPSFINATATGTLYAGDPAAQNQIKLIGSYSSYAPAIEVSSTISTNVPLNVVALGTGDVFLSNGNGVQFQAADSGGVVANVLSANGGIAGQPARVGVFGETNAGLNFFTQGSGSITFTAASAAFSGTLAAGAISGTSVAVSGSIVSTGPSIDQAYVASAPVTGATVTLTNAVPRAFVNPAGTIAALTVAFPTSPTNGLTVGISTTQTITAVTITASQSVFGGITTLAAGTTATFKFIGASNYWQRM